MKYLKYIFLILTNNINSVKKEILIEKNNKEKKIKKKEDLEIYNKEYSQLIKKKVYNLLKKYVNETNITTDNYTNLLDAENRKVVLSNIYENDKKDELLINNCSDKFYHNLSSKKSYQKKKEYLKKEYSETIKKEVDDLLNKYVNEKNITTDNYQELLSFNIRKIVLSNIYTKYEKDRLINKFGKTFYNNIVTNVNHNKRREDLEKYNEEYSETIKKKVDDLLNKYVNEKNITTNYKKLLDVNIRRMVLSDIYENDKKDELLINDFSNDFYQNIYRQKKKKI